MTISDIIDRLDQTIAGKLAFQQMLEKLAATDNAAAIMIQVVENNLVELREIKADLLQVKAEQP